MSMTVQVLMSPACGLGLQTIRPVSEVIATFAPEARLETLVISTEADAQRHRFSGVANHPIDGRDIDPDAPADVGVG